MVLHDAFQVLWLETKKLTFLCSYSVSVTVSNGNIYKAA